MEYEYVGDHPVDIPALGLTQVQPGQVLDVAEEINHSDFVRAADPSGEEQAEAEAEAAGKAAAEAGQARKTPDGIDGRGRVGKAWYRGFDSVEVVAPAAQEGQ